MKRVLPGLTLLLFFGCCALGYLLVRQKTGIAEAAAARTRAERDGQTQILILQHQLDAAKVAKADAEKQIAQLTRDAASATAKPKSTNGGSTVIHISDILKDHPEYTALYAKQMRRNIARMYGDSLNTLNLAPDQLSKLKDTLAERQMSGFDAQQAAEAAGLERGSPAWDDAMKQAAQEAEQQITAILGNNADSTLARLQARNGIQYQVDTSYSSDFSDAGVPLNPAQSSGLVQAMADANYAGKDLSTRPAGYNVPDPSTGLTPHDSRILDAAAQVLTPTQIQILKTDQIQYGQMSAIMKQYNTSGGQVIFVP